ncbi:AAA family ATPase [Gordonia sp. (in: high G+C Gram-positive bacteria)]|uniref:AAA family ATPase n=1 Tax=Gordonia sp. (in: high G+C Gram-positive bacteria) TaxID=84139 RepID=UPI0026342B54|nr:AAA family ATPase [Gordonia sp. (in: high G+C Gram-positive bacteria)]
MLKQFRSVKHADVRLGRLTILVGPNGSGKSNVLDALRLVAESLNTSLDQALRNRGGVGEVRRRSQGHPTHFLIDLEFTGTDEIPGVTDDDEVVWGARPFGGRYSFEVAAVAGGGYRVSKESCRVDDAFFEVVGGALKRTSEAVMPPANDQRLYLVSAAGLPAFLPVFEGLAGITVFSPVPDIIRQPQTPDLGDFLVRDGANLASVLQRLERTESGRKTKARIEEYLRVIVPGMQGVRREALGQWETLQFSQEVAGGTAPWRFPAQSVSDGTLRALAVLTGLFASTGSLRGPIGIEEPENALHPAAAAVLMDALREASERRQVIVTSHSADLLDRDDFSPDEILAVRSVAGETVVGALEPGGDLALRERLYTPGELLRRDQLLPVERSGDPQ